MQRLWERRNSFPFGRQICIMTLFLLKHVDVMPSNTVQKSTKSKLRWPAPLYNLYRFDSFLLICTSFVVRTRGIVCVVYLLSRLANYKDPCKRCVVALKVTCMAANSGRRLLSEKVVISLWRRKSRILVSLRVLMTKRQYFQMPQYFEGCIRGEIIIITEKRSYLSV